MNLNDYIIPGQLKVNTNVRKLLAKDWDAFNEIALKLTNKNLTIDCSTKDLIEVFYLFLNKNPDRYCKTCGQQTKFNGLKTGYTKYCNSRCQMQDFEQQQIRSNDAIERFGVKNYLLRGSEKSKITRQSVDVRIKMSVSAKNHWAKNHDAIVENLLKGKKAAKVWGKQFKNKIDLLQAQGFDIVTTNEFGKPTQIKHLECGNIQTYGRWANNNTYVCHKCYPNNRTIGEDAFFTSIETELGIKFLRHNRINGFIIDGIYKNIGIEYNGLFWHSTASFHAGFKAISPDQHLLKMQSCSDIGIKLIQIFENDWLYKKDIVIDRLRHILGLNIDKIYARKCIVEQISYTDAKAFLNKTHISGSVPASLCLALKYNDEIVSCITLGKSRFDKGAIELLRFATSKAVVGGLSRLTKHASNHYKTDILSYSDNMWGNGAAYEKSGFILIKNVKPGYQYYDKKNFNTFSRHAMRKTEYSKVFGAEWDNNLTEEENALKVNCFRIYDAGKKKWCFTFINNKLSI